MPRRGENIYKRKDGRWEGRILKEDSKYLYLYAKSYREIKEKMRNYQEYRKLSENKKCRSAKNAVGLFEDWLEGDFKNHLKPSTFESYYYCMQKYVIPFFQKSENVKITEEAVSRFVKRLKNDDSISESYKKKILTVFKTALKELLKGSPDCPAIMETIKLPKTEISEVQVFSMQEQRLIENAALNSDDRRALGIILCFYSGIRLGELCALKWSDIDMEAGAMSIVRTVSRTKNFELGEGKTNLIVGTPKSRKSTRKIPLPKFVLKLLEQHRPCSVDENSYVFSESSIPIDPRSYQKLFKKLLKSAGVSDRKFHAIRHTFATRALELGVDIKTLSEILGHSNVSITLNVYAHSLMEQKKIAIEKFNEMHIISMALASFAVANSVKSV